MSESREVLSRGALDLLLQLLNAPYPAVAGEVLFSESQRLATTLLQENWLLPAGVDPVVASGDRFYNLHWDSEHAAFRYFSPAAGWQTVSSEQVKRYTVNVDLFLTWLARALGVGDSQSATCLDNSTFWHLGYAYFGSTKVHLYFARRLASPEVQDAFLKSLRKESSRMPAAIVTSGRQAPAFLDLPLDTTLVSLRDILVRAGECPDIDRDALSAIVHGNRHEKSDNAHGGIALRFSADYRLVVWNGQRYALTKKQAAVMEALDKEGGRAHKDFLCAQADTNEELHRIMRNKVDGCWVVHPLWQTLIKGDGNGYYYLNLGQ